MVYGLLNYHSLPSFCTSLAFAVTPNMRIYHIRFRYLTVLVARWSSRMSEHSLIREDDTEEVRKPL